MRHSIRTIRRFPLIAALVTALASAAAATAITPVAIETSGAPPAAIAGDAAFRASIDQFIDQDFRLHPESATRAGDHRFDAQATDLSRRGIEAQIRFASQWKTRFSQIDPGSLSSDDEADREWLVATCDSYLLDAQTIRNYQREPGMYVPTSGIYALIERDFAPLEKRMTLVAARERAALLNFQAARENLRPDTMPKIAARILAQQMAATLGFFANELPAAFASVPQGPARADFDDANRKTIAALNAYQRWLMAEVAP